MADFGGECEMEDRRVTKTKKNIRESFIKILSEKPFDDITVTELCQEAGMSRITFYTHYSDKYELTEFLFNDLMETIEQDYKSLADSALLEMTSDLPDNFILTPLDVYLLSLIKNPKINATRSSLIINAGTIVVNGTSSYVSYDSPEISINNCKSFACVCLPINSLNGSSANSNTCSVVISPLSKGSITVVFKLSKVGHIMKKVKNKASPIRT